MELLRPHLDGFHDPTQDLFRDIARRTEELTRHARDENQLTDRAGLVALQARIRAGVLAGIGGPLPAPDSPVAVTSRGQAPVPPGTPYRIERLLLTTRPGVQVPTTVYVPIGQDPAGQDLAGADQADQGPAGQVPASQDLAGPHPVVLFLAGHEPEAKAAADYQKACGLFAARGYLVAAFDPHGQGERHSYLLDGEPQIAPGTTEHTYAGLPCWWAGLSAARYFVDDACRVLDYILGREDVDDERVVATGSSGGGMLTTLLMALEPRLTGAAPATYITSRLAYLPTGGRQDAEQILLGGTVAGIDHDWLLLAMAPRPVCVLAVDSDFFPLEGTEDSVRRARPAWQMYGAEDALEMVHIDSTHRYHPRLAELAATFFDRVLDRPAEPPVPVRQTPILAAADLHCTDSGQTGLEPGGAHAIHDRLGAELAALPAEASTDRARRWLRGVVDAHRQPIAARVRRLPADGGWHVLWRNEAEIWGCGLLHGAGRGPVRRVVLGDQGSADELEQQDLLLDASTLILDVRGRGPLAPHERDGRCPTDQASATYKILSDLLWLDDSLAAAQVWDVLRAIDLFAADHVELVGVGYGAYLARLAAFCDDRVRTLQVRAEYVHPDRFWQQRYYDEGQGAWHGLIPGLLRHCPWELVVEATDPLRRTAG